MTKVEWQGLSQADLRGKFIEWSNPGDTVEGIVTHINLGAGGNVAGLLQIHDSSVGDQGEGDHGFYRKIDLSKKAMRGEIDRCLHSGLKPGWHIRLTYTEDVSNHKPGHYPWKRFKALLAEPTKTPEEVEQLIANGMMRWDLPSDGYGPDVLPAVPELDERRKRWVFPSGGYGQECLSLDEIAEVLRPAFEASDAEKAYLFGAYVRLERLGDPRRGDEMEMLIVADIPETNIFEERNHFRNIRETAAKHDIYFTIHSVWSPESVAKYGSDANLMRNFSRDWQVVYER